MYCTSHNWTKYVQLEILCDVFCSRQTRLCLIDCLLISRCSHYYRYPKYRNRTQFHLQGRPLVVRYLSNTQFDLWTRPKWVPRIWRISLDLRPCKINYLVLRYRHVSKKSAAGLYLSPSKNKYNGKKVCVQIFAPFSLN